MNINPLLRLARMLCCAALVGAAGVASAELPGLPDFTKVQRTGGGEKDAAVIVAVEKYFALPPIPGAKENALAWYDYLTRGRSVPAFKVALLRDDDATSEGIRSAAEKATREVEPGGTLWFVFIGHGYATKADGPLLVAVDAQQKLSTLAARSIAREGLRKLLETGKAEKIVMLIDACFSGRTGENKELLPGLQPIIPDLEPVRSEKTVVLTAAGSGEVAGPLPGAARPAFSILALGALRGWADANDDGKVTGAEVRDFTGRILGNLRDRKQIPTAEGAVDTALSASVERKIDIDKLMAAMGFSPRAPVFTRPPADTSSGLPWYKSKKVWGWVGIGVGAALGGGALASALTAPTSAPSDKPAYDSHMTNAYVLGGIGAAVGVTGLVLVLLGDSPAVKTSTAWRVLPLLNGLSLSRSF